MSVIRKTKALEFLKIIKKAGTLMSEVEELLDFGKDELLSHEEKQEMIATLLETKSLEDIMVDIICKMTAEEFKNYQTAFEL